MNNVLQLQQQQDNTQEQGYTVLQLARFQPDVQIKPYQFGSVKEIQLRDIQLKTKCELYRRYRLSDRKFVIQAPAGSGKTILGIEFAKDFLSQPHNKDKYVFFCVHLKSLLHQAKEEFEKFLGEKVGIIQGDTPLHLDRQIQITMLQTLGNRLNSKNEYVRNVFRSMKKACIFIDECHIKNKAALQVINNIEEQAKEQGFNYLVAGLSGTPFSSFLGKLYGQESLVKVSTMREQISQGVIVDYHMTGVKKRVDTSKLEKNKQGEFTGGSVTDAVMDFLELGGNPAEDWWEDEKTRNQYTLVFCKNIKEAEAIYKCFVNFAEDTGNIESARIAIMHSKIGDDEVADIRRRAKNGDILILISVAQIAIGFDAKHFSVRLNFRPFAEHPYIEYAPNALAAYVQVFARVARQFNGGYRCIASDTNESFIMEFDKKDLIAARVIGKDEIVYFTEDDVIDINKYNSIQYKIIETMPKKEFAIHKCYVGSENMLPPQDIDDMFDSLPKEKTKKEKKELAEKLEKEQLERLEKEPEKAVPKITCGKCGELHKPPHCPKCGNEIKKVTADIFEDVELKFSDGEWVVTHTPDNITKKLERLRKQKEKDEKKAKRVNWKKLTFEQKVFTRVAAMITINEDRRKYNFRDVNKAINARYFATIDPKKEGLNSEVSGKTFNSIKNSANNHYNYVYAELGKGNFEPLSQLNKYINRARKFGGFGRK